MAIRTQGTNLYALDPSGDGTVVDVGCVTNISGIDDQLDEIETTCLSADFREYLPGLSTPGTATFTVQFDPTNPVHVTMFKHKKANDTLHWAVGFRDQTAIDAGTAPTVPMSTQDSSGEHIFTLGATRSWIVFEGYMNSYPFEFAGNSVVTSNIGIRISGEIDVFAESASS